MEVCHRVVTAGGLCDVADKMNRLMYNAIVTTVQRKKEAGETIDDGMLDLYKRIMEQTP